MARTLTLPTHSSTDDPLTLALLPPPDETPAQKAARLQREALAKQKSDAIDHEIEKEKKKRRAEGRSGSGGKGGGRCVKVLLLGQSESGKSTTLKNFQLTYAPQAWSAEKLAWRAVIFLNLVRAINTICDAVRREIEFSNVRQRGVGSSGSLNLSLSLSRGIDEEEELEIEVQDVLSDASPSPSTSPPRSPIVSPSPSVSTSSPALSASASSPNHVSLPSLSTPTPSHPLTTLHSDLVTRLEPLKVVQKELERRLGAGSGEDYGAFGFGPPGVGVSTVEGGRGDPEKEDHGFGAVGQTSYALAKPCRPQEFFVRSTGWKKLALAHAARSAYASIKPRLSTSSRRPGGASSRYHDHDEHAANVDESHAPADSDTDWIEDVVREVVKRREVMKSVWADRAVREVVRKRKVGVGEAGEFFLKEIDRIAKPDYMPSDDDVVRARLRTVGVQEHRLVLETGPEAGSEWTIYDVGGSRSMRAQWPSYFDTVNAIIFLAPIACFDEHLLENPSINRLDDTFQLWKIVCENKLLQNTELVLFLNKCDLLRRKLERGVRFGEWVTSYDCGNGKERRENDATAVGRYLKTKFTDIFRQQSSSQRGLHVHFTSVVDTKATAITLGAVQDGILRGHLRTLELI